ncbi:MAG: MBL fold metallo-hydrolase [Firmicutes bacterium]|nr:MBL fold metallo-hydrolase [Bacillota bacterium]
MRIAQGVEMLEIPSEMFGPGAKMNLTLLYDEQDAILVDAGLAGCERAIIAAMEAAGVPFDRLNKIIVTHHDFDHLSGLPGLLKLAGRKIEVLAHTEEIPYIEGTKDLTEKVKKAHADLPAEQLEAQLENYRKREKVAVDIALADGQELPYCGGIIAVHTPGHTPGHLCLYLKNAKTVVAGDATVADNGKLFGPAPIFTVDMPQAVKSVQKIAALKPEKIICYHGGLVSERVAEQLLAIK